MSKEFPVDRRWWKNSDIFTNLKTFHNIQYDIHEPQNFSKCTGWDKELRPEALDNREISLVTANMVYDNDGLLFALILIRIDYCLENYYLMMFREQVLQSSGLKLIQTYPWYVWISSDNQEISSDN